MGHTGQNKQNYMNKNKRKTKINKRKIKVKQNKKLRQFSPVRGQKAPTSACAVTFNCHSAGFLVGPKVKSQTECEQIRT